MKAIVTGCAGFIGSHLTEALLDAGVAVTGIDCFAATYETARRRDFVARTTGRAGFAFIEGDLRDMDLQSVFEGHDVVYHLAARPGVRASWSDFSNVNSANVLGTQRVLEGVRWTGGRLVFASSSSVYGTSTSYPTTEDSPVAPISPYGVSKAASEALVHAYSTQFGVNAVSLRYFTVYGPRQRSDMAFSRWIASVLGGDELLVYGDGTTVRDFTYVDDVVSATMRAGSASRSGHSIYNVAGGSPVSIQEVIELIGRLVGRAPNLRFVSRPAGDPDRTGGATGKIRAELSWAPGTALEEGLERQVSWTIGES